MLHDSTTHFFHPSISWLLSQSVTFYFLMSIIIPWPHCSCPHALLPSNKVPAHQKVAAYLALLPLKRGTVILKPNDSFDYQNKKRFYSWKKTRRNSNVIQTTIFSCVLCDSSPRFVHPSLCPLVGQSPFTSFVLKSRARDSIILSLHPSIHQLIGHFVSHILLHRKLWCVCVGVGR